jgi:hypothetical protein
MTFDKDFKEAIRQLPEAEKDKLIFRLLKHDLDLANQLLFKLVSGDSCEDRRKKAKKGIERIIGYAQGTMPSTYFTPGIMLMAMRDASGIINEHARITKDKYGEAYLHVFLLKEFMKIYNDKFMETPAEKSYTFNIYAVARAFKIMAMLKKLHEDYLIDFTNDIEEIGTMFSKSPVLMKVAIHNGLDVNWLINNNIPENIAKIEKDLRKRGYLK